VILSTHILSEASQICGRILIINNGKIVAEDTPQRLTETLKGYDRILIRAQSAPESAAKELMGVDGVCSVEQNTEGAFELSCAVGKDNRAQIAALVVNRGWGLLEMRPLVMGLEEIFLKLTQESVLAQESPEEASEEVETDA
jgi:ABC-2 type transport system ATP-binding protein